MQKLNYSTTIAIDSERSVFHFYSMSGTDKSTVVHHIKSYAGGQFNEDFFNKFKEAISDFARNNPSEAVRKVTVILPDNAVLTDTVRVPTMKGLGQTKKALDITLGGLYRNYKELRVLSQVAEQNKQYTTFEISAVQKNVISSIYASCSENKLLTDTLTYAAAASVGGAALINPKLKNASYLFLDIKDVYSRFVFVVNGKAVGSYVLPFGLEFLRKPKVTPEDMLFDHSYAALSVLNAKERARSKKLTAMDEFMDAVFEGEDEDYEAVEAGDAQVVSEDKEASDFNSDTEEDINIRFNSKLFTKKSPRKLPKFMLRDIPETEEGILYENFRVFVKWALNLIHDNEKLTELGKPAFVCVNLPSDLVYVLDKVNEESEENGISFTALTSDEVEPAVLSNLELYGSLFPKFITSMGKF